MDKFSNQVFEIICYIEKFKRLVNNPYWDGLLKFNNKYYNNPNHLYEHIIRNIINPDENNDYYRFVYNNNKTKIVITFKDLDDIIAYIFEFATEICNPPAITQKLPPIIMYDW